MMKAIHDTDEMDYSVTRLKPRKGVVRYAVDVTVDYNDGTTRRFRKAALTFPSEAAALEWIDEYALQRGAFDPSVDPEWYLARLTRPCERV